MTRRRPCRTRLMPIPRVSVSKAENATCARVVPLLHRGAGGSWSLPDVGTRDDRTGTLAGRHPGWPAIPLNPTIDGPSWIEPWLGYFVVAAAGIERIFARTSAKASAVDSLRRDLEQRTRRLKAGAIPPYPDATFAASVEACEKSISAHNQEVIKRNRRLFGG